MKAWVVSVKTDKDHKVLCLLRPGWSSRTVRKYLANLNYLFCLSLDDQAATFRRKNPFTPTPPQDDHGYELYFFTEGSHMISAQYSDVLGIEDQGGRQVVTWRTIPFVRRAAVPSVEVPAKTFTASQVQLRPARLVE